MVFKRLFLFVWLSATITVAAQTDFASLGSFWNYHYSAHDGGWYAYETIKVTKDTTIGGYPAKFLTKYQHTYSALPPYHTGKTATSFGVLQVRSDSIFHYWTNPGNRTFLFSFSMQVGDTIGLSSLSPHFIAIVDTVFNVVINGDTMRQWTLGKYCSGNLWYHVNIIENIGQIDDYLFWNEDGCIIGGGTWDFQCFGSPNLKYNEPCEPVIVGIQPTTENQTFELSPNPADNQLSIISPVPFKEVIIYNQLGQHLKTFHFPLRKQTVINLHELTSRLYIVLIKGDEVAHSKSFLIQR